MSSKITPECKQIISVLRPIVISRKQPCSLVDVLKDYRELEGGVVPYKKFGFQSVEEFLQESGEFILTKYGGSILVAVRNSKNSAHITSMVRCQKSAKTNKKKAKPQFQFRQPTRSDQSWNKSSYSTQVYPKMNYGQNRYPNAAGNMQQRRPSQPYSNGDSNNNNQSNRNQYQYQPNAINKPDLRHHLNAMNANNSNQLQQHDLRNRLNAMNANNANQQDLRNLLNSKKAPNAATARPILGHNTQSSNYNNSQSLSYQNVVAAQTAALVASQIITAQRNAKETARAAAVQNIQNKSNQMRPNSTSPSGLPHSRVDKSKQPAAVPTSAAAQVKNKSSVQDRLRVQIAADRYNGSTSSGSMSSTPTSTPSSAGTDHSNNPFANNKSNAVINNETEETKKFVPPNDFQFNPELCPVISLQQYCIVRRYAKPEFKVMKSKFTRNFHCRVLVNGCIYSTYPDEQETGELSKLACAAKAIEEIKLLEARQQYPMCEDSDCVLALKIFQELKNHPHGVFAKNFNDWFEKTFQQCLPDHWFSIVEASNQFMVEMAPVGDNMIIFANSDISKSETTSSASSEMDLIILDRLSLPWDSKYWNIHITHCASSVDVWARLVGPDYSDLMDNLMTDIDVYMLTDKARPTSISCGQIYLVCISECWHRVRVDHVDKSAGQCLCFFLDYGDEDMLPVEQIYICESKFLKLAPQAVLFTLFGLEDFAENPIAKRHLEATLTGKSLVAEVLTKQEAYDLSCVESNDYCPKIQMALYDTSSSEDVNLNLMLMNKICDDTPPPELKKTTLTNVNITHIADNGDVYLQVRNIGLSYVQKLINQLVQSKFKVDQHKVTTADIRNYSIFLIRDEDSNRWYRAELIDSNAQSEEYNMLYLDYGLTKKTHISQIFRLESLSAALTKYPRQALKTRLHNLPPITPSIVQRIRGLLPFDCPAIVKLMQPGLVPQINVYTRFNENQSLFLVNECIRIEYELETTSDPSVADLTITGKKSQSPVPSLRNSPTDLVSSSLRNMSLKSSPITVINSPQHRGELPKIQDFEDIPAIGQYFDVVVAMASNPYNFTIQPYKDYPKLVDLMAELQTHCENSKEYIPADMVERGQAYASRFSDGSYHRVIVENVLSPTMIHVFFCDSGHVAVLSSADLKVLPAKFRQLPKQALQAKLYGVKPKNTDWTMDDCMRFKKLTFGEKFVSVIKNITNDELSGKPNSKILELELIDVKTSQDVFIHKIFLEESRAILS